ncbi:MAG TPA: hypothetical protein DCQ28_07075 [Bacteroidetes bacterium]|nr:hypothetical protein [Bacteroidota bacterium]
MKRKQTVLLIVVFVLAIAMAQAQVAVSDVRGDAFGKSVYGIGFSGGPASGVGFSVRYHTPGKTSLQAVVGVFKPKNTDTFYSFGAEYQHDLTRSNSARFFFDAASSFIYNGSGTNNYTAPFRFGAGLGGEFLLQDAVHVSFQGLFTYFSDGTILPLPQLAIHYYFY